MDMTIIRETIGLIFVGAILFYVIARGIDHFFLKREEDQVHEHALIQIRVHAKYERKNTRMSIDMAKKINDNLLKQVTND